MELLSSVPGAGPRPFPTRDLGLLRKSPGGQQHKSSRVNIPGCEAWQWGGSKAVSTMALVAPGDS